MEQINQDQLFQELLKSPINNNYYQLPCGFDIESSSYRNKNGDKHAVMYIWQIGFLLNNIQYYVYGRMWHEWETFVSQLKQKMKLSKYKLIIYVHNLSYEFQWIYTHLYLTKVFSRKKRHPIYAESNNLIFKCSYFLSNMSLRNLAKERGYTQKENMDYSLIRLPCTELTKEEISYALTDVKIICEYLQDEINKNETIQNIPLTSTGYVRRYCFDYIKDHENIYSYQKWLRSILPVNEHLFELLYTAYTGAFTHSNYKLTAITLENVHCVDYSSDYPGIMCRKKFPMRFDRGNPKKLRYYDGLAKVMKITFNKIVAKTSHSIISQHKCSIMEQNDFETIVDNGRIRKAFKLTTVITDLDYDIIHKFYDIESEEVTELWVADYRYLPKNLILPILDLYANKTELKGVKGKEDVYMRSKNLINSVYGMSVTNPLNDEIIFDYGEWLAEPTDTITGLQKYQKGRKIFTAYQWGVWVTAWARWELLNTVYKIGNDVIYCDTDSIKFLNDHSKIIEDDNRRILKENDDVIKFYNIDRKLFYPKTFQNETKPLGVWDYEPDYQYFKTLGAKRYCFCYFDDYFKKKFPEEEYNFFITVAGLPKSSGKEAIIKRALEKKISPFDIFDYELENEENYTLTINEEETQKITISYHNEPFSEYVEDYQGNSMKVHETSFAFSEKVPFAFNATDDYLMLLGILEASTNIGGSFNPTKITRRILNEK
ncbi:MAG: hypothetical protein IKY41_09555 [Clostridia bacterium]|nr:hypothetical protein [Clostridia bacterium]